jgi:hypothetical protein
MVSLIIVGNIRMAPKSSYDGLNDLYVAYSAFVVHSFQNCKDFYAMLVLCAPAGQDEQWPRRSAKPQAIYYLETVLDKALDIKIVCSLNGHNLFQIEMGRLRVKVRCERDPFHVYVASFGSCSNLDHLS